MKAETKYTAAQQEVFRRYKQFQDNFNNPDSEIISVFEPLPQKYVDEIHLIREVSKDLQEKKIEDMNKAAAAAREMKEAEAKRAQEAAEEAKETQQNSE